MQWMNPAAKNGPELIVLFDGHCNLCNGSVQFIIARDPENRFKFAALDSIAAQDAIRSTGMVSPLPDSMVLIESGSALTQSTAALHIARRLPNPWPLLYAFIIIPRPIRNWLYDIVARNRYSWFGRRESCMIPTPELRQRFLD
jgi:predicted DCC family thiol-disulfide oxidoreductase YuxK